MTHDYSDTREHLINSLDRIKELCDMTVKTNTSPTTRPDYLQERIEGLLEKLRDAEVQLQSAKASCEFKAKPVLRLVSSRSSQS